MADLNEHLSTRVIELVLADVSDERSRAHLDACAVCADKLAAAKADRESFLAANPPSLRAAQIWATPRPRPRPQRRWLWLVPTLAAASLAIVFWRTDVTTDTTPRPQLLDKGAASVSLTVKRGQAVTAAHSGDLFVAGDAVQLSVTISAPSEVAIYSVGKARPQKVWSESLTRSGPLGHSFLLDDAAEDEHLWVVIAKSAAAIQDWETRAVGPTPPSVTDGIVQVVLLRKRAP